MSEGKAVTRYQGCGPWPGVPAGAGGSCRGGPVLQSSQGQARDVPEDADEWGEQSEVSAKTVQERRSLQHLLLQPHNEGFPGGSDSKESVCNAGDPGLIPGSGRSPGEGNGNPLQ